MPILTRISDEPKAYIDIDGEYGSDLGSIRIYDKFGEVVMWDCSEWAEDPSLMFVIANAIREALLEGTDRIRTRIGHEWPDYPGWPPDYDRVYWFHAQQGRVEPSAQMLIKEWERGTATFEDPQGWERTCDWWFGFPPTTLKFDIWHWVDDHLPNGIAVDILNEEDRTDSDV